MSNTVRQRGFSLVEIVVVITILGILASFAVPRFASLEGQARLAATQALAGSVRSGASLAHALWLAQGDTSSTSITMEGEAISLAYGYPDGVSIEETLVDYVGFELSVREGAATFIKEDGNGDPIANCFVTYTPPAAASQAPEIKSTTGGC